MFIRTENCSIGTLFTQAKYNERGPNKQVIKISDLTTKQLTRERGNQP
jgi:hypothetical protein